MMPTPTPSVADDWELCAAQRIAAAGVDADRSAVVRSGRTLARLARTFGAATAPSVTAAAAARAGVSAHAAFVAALASLARE
jgi:hypothetical protein